MFELFKIGFISFTIVDLFDIAIVSFLIYKLYELTKGTIAAQIFLGLIFVLVLSFLAQAANFLALGYLLRLITDIWVIAFIVLFQPEIRRILIVLGRNPFLRLFLKSEERSTSDILVEVAFDMAQYQHGALMVVVKSTGIKGVVETGELLNAKVNHNLLRSIFFPRSPLHDGAVIIRNDIIEAARCTLPLTSATKISGRDLGMRHRAGLGISEQADVISIIVSEETGSISIAEDGVLEVGLSRDKLRRRLESSMQMSREKGWKGVFDHFTKIKK
ncbi:MAG: diadenylate cyclase CdaA [Melioribacteraceae bacterium]|nr:diadenylate cyclase CdaA [Melioribacteraceae bacterium]MCF8413353.1 diadenylate cyclase CdaA [Melioribacteraceae bacterium]